MLNLNIPDGTLLTKEELAAQLKEHQAVVERLFEAAVAKILSATQDPGTKPVPDKPVEPEKPVPDKPALPKCDQGPLIKKVEQRSEKSFELLFHAEKVFVMEISVTDEAGKDVFYAARSTKNEGKSLIKKLEKSDKHLIEPDNNHPLIFLTEEIKPGRKYKVFISGVECSGSDTFFFETVTSPPPPPPPIQDKPCKPEGSINSVKFTDK